MHRFFIPSPDVQKNAMTITDYRVVHQVSKVLRMKPGSRFSVFNGAGQEYAVSVLEIGRHQVLCQLVEPLCRNTESPVEISLYQAIPKKTALFELVIQKATELGVAHIYPLITERTEKRRLSKFERMELIAIEASEQSGRVRVPIVHHPVSFEGAVEQSGNGYMGYEFEFSTFLYEYHQDLRKGGAVQIFIGPEGGFSKKEMELATGFGIHLFTLGPRTLRTETAAIASLAFLQKL